MKIFIGNNNACGLCYEHDVIYTELASKHELTEYVEEADVVVFPGSCCCTEFHILINVQYIEEVLKHKKENSKVYLTGCMSRKVKEDPFLTEYKEWLDENIDVIVPQGKLKSLLALISEDDYNEKDTGEFAYTVNEDRDVASIYISRGCLNNCSFCKTTFQDFTLTSVPYSQVVKVIDLIDEAEIGSLYIKGHNICQYGLDTENKHLLPELIKYIETKRNIKNVELIGFSFKDAIENGFDSVLKSSKKVNYISGSLESGSDRLLELIRKGFTPDQIINFVNIIRAENDIELNLNIIAGFPTETMEDVRMTLDVLKELAPDRVDICRYTNSSFVDSNQFQQLKVDTIQEHARVYSKVLTRRGIYVDINGEGYKFNNI